MACATLVHQEHASAPEPAARCVHETPAGTTVGRSLLVVTVAPMATAMCVRLEANSAQVATSSFV
jgi:hypothetical protein